MLSKIIQNQKISFLILILLCALMHLHVFNLDLVGVHVWRQSQTQINIENFAYTDFNILNTKSYNLNNPDLLLRYEFPLMQWVFALFYKLFGNHIFISRFLSFLIGLFSIIGINGLLSALFKNKRISAIGTWAFAFSPVFYYYMLNPLPDNLALCFAIWALYYFFTFVETSKKTQLYTYFLFILLATLTKLPFILYSTPSLIYFVNTLKQKKILATGKIIFFFLLILSPAFAWYLWVIPGWNGNGIVKGMMDTKQQTAAELFYILQHNLISTLPEMLLNYGSLLFFCIGLWFVFKYKKYKSEKGFYLMVLGLMVLLYFLFELNMIGTVHDYYLFPFLPLLFILVAYGANYLLQHTQKTMRTFALFCLCILPLTAFLRINQRWNTQEPGFNKDLYLYKKELSAAIPDSALCIAGNDISTHIWPYYLHKKCWCFYDNYLTEEQFTKYLAKGAGYLITDSKEVENLPFVKKHLTKLVEEKGSIRVFEINH